MKLIHTATALLLAALSTGAAAEIHIAETIPYRNAASIDHRITSECTAIGQVMSESLAEHAAKNKLDVVRDGRLRGDYVAVRIDSAVSAGNTFVGHAKGMTASAAYYADGRLVAKKSFTRHSSGGAFGGFKSSCAVLNRTASVLGKDIAKWLAAEQR